MFTIRFLRSFTINILVLFVSVCMPFSSAADEIIVSAAASLTNAMSEIGDAFQEEHPDIHVIFNFASSGSLVQQMLHGAPVDIFASASQKFMDDAQQHGLIREESRVDFARNALVLAVPAESASPVSDLSAIVQSKIVFIGIGNPESVPAGRYAKETLQSRDLWEAVQSKLVFGNSVRQVLDYLRRGEVDAGLIYATDAIITGDAVRIIESLETETPIVYPIAITTGCQQEDHAKEFVHFILEERGRTILSGFGFSAP